MTKATWKRIFISVDMDLKNHYSFNGDDLRLERDKDNFNKRYVSPVNGVVIDAENIPKGAEVLIHHNAVHDTYRIFDYKELGKESLSTSIKYFSIPETECYAWRQMEYVDFKKFGGGKWGEWKPCEGFEFGLRIFKPYEGILSGMFPTQVKNKLFITTGEYKNKVVVTKSWCDYEIIFQDKDGREGKLIRLRHFQEPENIREEIIGVSSDDTEKINDGKLLVGILPEDAKRQKIIINKLINA